MIRRVVGIAFVPTWKSTFSALLLLAPKLTKVDRIRNVWRRNAPHQSPIDPLKERMLLDLRRPSVVRDPPLRVLYQQPLYQIPSNQARQRRLREPERLPDHVLKRGPVTRALERRRPMQQLIQEDAEGPPVHRTAMPLAADDLRRQVLVRPYERHRPRVRRLRHELQVRVPVVVVAAAGPEIGLGLAILLWEDAGEEGRRLDAALHSLVTVDHRGVDDLAAARARR